MPSFDFQSLPRAGQREHGLQNEDGNASVLHAGNVQITRAARTACPRAVCVEKPSDTQKAHKNKNRPRFKLFVRNELNQDVERV